MEVYDFIKIGGKVKWNDPCIQDYPKSERKKLLNRVWSVDLINGLTDNTEIDDDSIITISDEYSEAQVCPCELEPFVFHFF